NQDQRWTPKNKFSPIICFFPDLVLITMFSRTTSSTFGLLLSAKASHQNTATSHKTLHPSRSMTWLSNFSLLQTPTIIDSAFDAPSYIVAHQCVLQRYMWYFANAKRLIARLTVAASSVSDRACTRYAQHYTFD
ncbi:unnamed protein product, partial [Laminaria digitata]